MLRPIPLISSSITTIANLQSIPPRSPNTSWAGCQYLLFLLASPERRSYRRLHGIEVPDQTDTKFEIRSSSRKDQVKAVKERRLACRETDTGDINSDVLTEVLGKDKKNHVHEVDSNITMKQLQHAAIVSALLNQMTTTSAAKVEADVATFKLKVKTDMSEVKSMLKILIQQQLGNNVTANVEAHMGVTTPRIEVGSSSTQCHYLVTPQNLTPSFGSLEQPRFTLLDKFGTEVAKGSVDISAKICHGRILVGGQRRVYIDKVLVPDAAIYDGP